jgi:hypothetical protein
MQIIGTIIAILITIDPVAAALVATHSQVIEKDTTRNSVSGSICGNLLEVLYHRFLGPVFDKKQQQIVHDFLRRKTEDASVEDPSNTHRLLNVSLTLQRSTIKLNSIQQLILKNKYNFIANDQAPIDECSFGSDGDDSTVYPCPGRVEGTPGTKGVDSECQDRDSENFGYK